VIGFAAEPRQVAAEGTQGNSSPYGAALVTHLKALPQYEFDQIMTMVGEEVALATQGQQQPWTSASLKRALNFGGQAEAPASDDARLSEERHKLLLAIAAAPPETRLAVENLGREQALPLDPLFGMLQQMHPDMAAGPEERDEQLRAGAETLKSLLAERSAPLRKDPEVVRLSGLADEALRQGAIDLAIRYRAMAAGRANDLDDTLDKRGPAVPVADRVELASVFGDYGDTVSLSFDYRRAAEQYRKALEQIGGRSPIWGIVYGMSEADALARYGRYKGDDNATRSAAAIYQSVVSDAGQGKNPVAWADAQSKLGGTLQVLASRTGNRDYAVNSVAAYQAALTQWTREQFPLEWAMAQNNLAGALRSLGENETGTESLGKAVTAFQAALTELRRDRTPREWAKAQYGLGIALRVLGERKNDAGALTGSLAALEAALGESKRERDPMGWGIIQYNMANAQQSLGRIERNP
jgi:tetratricopeptide (TPR) repeat protein